MISISGQWPLSSGMTDNLITFTSREVIWKTMATNENLQNTLSRTLVEFLYGSSCSGKIHTAQTYIRQPPSPLFLHHTGVNLGLWKSPLGAKGAAALSFWTERVYKVNKTKHKTYKNNIGLLLSKKKKTKKNTWNFQCLVMHQHTWYELHLFLLVINV